MQSSDMNMDTEAFELYSQLEGLDPRELEKISFTGDGFSQGLTEAEMRNDAIRMLLADFVHQVSRSLLRSPDGKNRIMILAASDGDDGPWPDQRYLRQGVRARGWVLLEQVKLGFELWRRFNAVPPSLAAPDDGDGKSKSKGDSSGGKK